jgi:alpha-galactosidase
MSFPGRLALALLLLTCGGLPAQARAEGPPSKSTSAANTDTWDLQSPNLRIEFDSRMRSRVVARVDGKERILGPFTASESLTGAKRTWKEFDLVSHRRERVTDTFGAGERLVLKGASGPLTKTVTVTIYEAFPTLALFNVDYTNTGETAVTVTGWTNHTYALEAKTSGQGPAFWSYQCGSYERRPNWLLPLKVGFRQENYLGMNAPDYGGGTPIVDVWSREGGLGMGHLGTSPEIVSLPVAMPKAGRVQMALHMKQEQSLAPGATLRTLRTFISVHQGDCFSTLVAYRKLMALQGLGMAESPESAFGPIWCAWGYGRKVQPQQIYKTLPTVKQLGFTWVTVDDGWQDNYADWLVDPKKFPNGDEDMKAMVDRIHGDGFLAQLWWAPLMGSAASRLLKEHPEFALLNRDGARQKISYWPTFYLCPAVPGVVEFSKNLAKKMILDWGYDGLKLDGQYMNGVPPCYNPAHHHEHPEDSLKALPLYFKAIFETARSLKPQALVEFCPCGTSYSFFTMPYFNMSVASDPTSSFQVRSKGKVLKALMGDGVAYFGDHVELSDGANDYASTVAVGGVVGTQFVLPDLAPKRSTSDLTPGRKQTLATWLGIYRKHLLSKGEYLGQLYDIGFDLPETHAIRKGDSRFYGFFAKRWTGPLELRGLEARSYRIRDYEHDRDLGLVKGPRATLDLPFSGHLLIEATPE